MKNTIKTTAFILLGIAIAIFMGILIIQPHIAGNWLAHLWQKNPLNSVDTVLAEPIINSESNNPNTETEVNDTDELSNKEYLQDLHPTKLIIPKLKFQLPIVSVPLENGTWIVHDHVANYAEGTSLIDETGGNVGLYGHDRPHAFSPIKKLTIGDQIQVQTSEGYMALYRVIDGHEVTPEQVTVFYPSVEPRLTLLTCSGIFSERRYIIVAELDRIEKI
jgi:LPXTG-site transpeptidase (sortase) family protein